MANVLYFLFSDEIFITFFYFFFEISFVYKKSIYICTEYIVYIPFFNENGTILIDLHYLIV